MELAGFGFFQGFMHYLGVLQWPLVVVFLLYIAWQIRGFAPEERLQTGLMFSYFFLVITTFWILKPLKKGLFIGYYKGIGGFDLLGWQLDAAQAELLAKVLNMAVAAAAVAVFTLLARSFRRQQLTFILSGFFILCYLAFSFLLDNAGGGTVWTFYLFGVLFGLGFGGEMSAYLVVNRQYFGTGPMATLYGYEIMGAMMGHAIATLLGGLVREITGSFLPVFALSMGFSIVGAVVILTLESTKRVLIPDWENSLPAEARSENLARSGPAPQAGGSTGTAPAPSAGD